MNEDLFTFVSRQKYLSDIPFIFGRNIFEYDIRQANIHALLASNIITRSEFEYLSLLPKELRERDIGMRIRDNKVIYAAIQDIICKAKYEFVERNNISPDRILRIANDALYIIAPVPVDTDVVIINDVPITFALKNNFTNYIKLGNLLIFCNTMGEYWNVDVKGISESKLIYHKDMISAICGIIDARNNGGVTTAITEFNDLYNKYIKFELPVGYYRELNGDSMFRITSKENFEFCLITIDEKDKNQINISYNQSILRTLYSYLLQS